MVASLLQIVFVGICFVVINLVTFRFEEIFKIIFLEALFMGISVGLLKGILWAYEQINVLH